jgi:hypothetical protein
MPKKLIHVAVTHSSERRPTRESLPHLALVRPASPDSVTLDEELVAFDADEDMASLIAMPRSIPAATRARITSLAGERFEHSEHLDAWLHAPNDQLDGETPFDRIIEGDGAAVLRALRSNGSDLDVQAGAATEDQQPTLRLVR